MKIRETSQVPSIKSFFDPRAFVAATRLLVVALMLSLFAIPAAAEFKPGKYIEPNPLTDWFVRHVRNGMVKRLDLTDDQLLKIMNEIDPYREELIVDLEAIKDARMRLFENIRAEPYDAASVGLIFEELRAKELGLLLRAGHIYQGVWGILTPAQKSEADEMVAEVISATELRFSDFRESFMAGELLGISTR